MSEFTGKKQIGNYLVSFVRGKQISKTYNSVDNSTTNLREKPEASPTGKQKLSPRGKAKRDKELAAKKKAYTYKDKFLNFITSGNS